MVQLILAAQAVQVAAQHMAQRLVLELLDRVMMAEKERVQIHLGNLEAAEAARVE